MGTTEAKAQLSALVEDAIRGRETVITKHGKPVAKLVPYSPPKVIFGLLEGKIPEWDDIDPSAPRLSAEALASWKSKLEGSLE